MPWRTLLVTNGRRIAARSSAGMPGPVSLTITCPTPAPTATSTVTSPPTGVACSAFVTRFVTICRMRSPSPSTTGSRGDVHLQVDAAAAGLLALGAGRALADGDEVDLLDVERELARLEAGQVEQVADQALQAPGLGEHDLERRLAAPPRRR